MGGYGSGRWHGHLKADTVEDCLTLDISDLARRGFMSGALATGRSRWVNQITGEELASVGIAALAVGSDRYIQLVYSATRDGAKEHINEAIRLQKTHPHFGGVRWWLTCPLSRDGRECLRRVQKLYMPPRGLYFGCRHCHRLAYRSSQEHDKSVDQALRMPPAHLLALAHSGDARAAGLVLRAIQKLM